MPEKEQRQRAQVIDTRAEVLLREVEARAKMAEIQASKSASDLAAEHLSVWAGAYLMICVVCFLAACLFLPESTISVVAGLITLIVTSLTGILKSVVGDPGSKSSDSKDEANGGPKK